MTFLRLSFAAIAVLAATAGTPRAAPPPDALGSWQATIGIDHPLTGRIWRPGAGLFVTPEKAIGRLATVTFRLLGETHDNPDHHRLQGWAIERLAARGLLPAVAFEMLTPEQAPALAAHRAARPGDVTGLETALAWSESGWPAWPLYEPVFRAALEARLPILPANLSRERIRAVVREGAAAVLGAEEAAALGIDGPLPAALEDALRAELVESHCGQLPESLAARMVEAQRTRDARMAAALFEGADRPDTDGAVLIAGNGHARIDRGAPYYLVQRGVSSEDILSLGFIEVSEDLRAPADYAEHFGAIALPFDLVWFTPRAERKDPCAEFAEALERARERHEADDPADNRAGTNETEGSD
ncbi:MAG TPA: ChaN family lipoprotein [Kiloniellales bacterium]|nr:ChaN family lipoprotein [Kiloniellales bacterium]